MGLISDGTTIFDAGAMSAGLGGSMVFIKKLTASSSATLSFVHGSGGVDFSTYKEYIFIFNNLHPSAENTGLFNFTTDGTNYNVTKTTTSFAAYHEEGDSAAALGYVAAGDLAQSTAFQNLSPEGSFGAGNDECFAAVMHIFNPSSTTFVKHFLISTSLYESGNYAEQAHISGYANTTSALTGVQFKMSSGDIDAGTITLYGIA